MGASLMKGSREKKELIEEKYKKYLKDGKLEKFEDFYHAVCETVEAINNKFGNTQIRIPRTEDLRHEFQRLAKDERLTTEGFQEILKTLVSKAGFTNFGALEPVLYILGAPVAAAVIKQAANPKAISNNVLIPGVTSATVLILAALKKI